MLLEAETPYSYAKRASFCNPVRTTLDVLGTAARSRLVRNTDEIVADMRTSLTFFDKVLSWISDRVQEM